MKLALIPLLFLSTVAIAADNALRALLDVHAIEFQIPAMKKESMCDLAIVTYVDGVLENKPEWVSFSSAGGQQKMEVLWRRDEGKTKIVFARDGMSTGMALPLFPETACASKGSSGKPIAVIEDGWKIMGYWSLDMEAVGKIYYEDFQQEVKAHKRVVAIAVREGNPLEKPNPEGSVERSRHTTLDEQARHE